HSGDYGFNTMSGDVRLLLPGDASFRLVAKLSQDGEIVTDFPLKITAETVPPAKAKTPAIKVSPPPPTPAPSSPAPMAAPAPASPKPDTAEASPEPDNVTVVKVSPTVK